MIARAAAGGLLAIVATAGGCGAPLLLAGASLNAVGLSAVAYVNGEIQAAEVAKFDRVVAATQRSLARLEFKVKRVSTEENGTFIEAEEIGGRTVSIAILRKTPAVTKITIRFSVLGDQPMSRLLIAVIQDELEHDDARQVLPPLEP